MPFEIKELTLASTDNIHILVGKVYIPTGEIKGLFHIIHGMTEHIERYDRFMSALAQEGYLAFGYDNLGHGKTARNDSELGFIAHTDRWKYLINDAFAFENAVKKLYPDLPIIIFGHSMGSFIARLCVSNYPQMYHKAIFCGTAGKNPLSPFGLLLTSILKALKGEKYISDLILNMAFGAYNKKFDGDTNYEWLTKDRSIIEKYSADKFCTFKFTVSAMHDLIKLISESNKLNAFDLIPKDLPIFLISGDTDPVGNYGKGVKWVYDKLVSLNIPVKMKLYKDCRHEILNDSCYQETLIDILNFSN